MAVRAAAPDLENIVGNAVIKIFFRIGSMAEMKFPVVIKIDLPALC